MSRTVSDLTVLNQLTISGATVVNGTGGTGGILTFPTSSTTIVGTDTTNTLTNKTITGTTNNVDANNLRNGSSWVIPLSGVAPTNGQILTYNGTGAVWMANDSNVTTATTSGATATTLDTVATTSDTSYFIKTKIIARRSDSGSETNGYQLIATFQNVSGTVTQVTTTDRLEFENSSAWNAVFTISGTDILIVVTGETGKTIQWKGSTEVISV